MTLPQLRAVGLEPIVNVDRGRPDPARNRANFEHFLRLASQEDADLLVFEDDVDVRPDLPHAVEAARRFRDVGVVFWLCKVINHPASWEGTLRFGLDAPPTGFYPVRRFNLWFGTQALYLPRAVVQALASDATFGVPDGRPFDRWLRDHIPRLLVALPNPVQHRSPPTLVDSKRVPRISPTYHIPRYATDWGC